MNSQERKQQAIRYGYDEFYKISEPEESRLFDFRHNSINKIIYIERKSANVCKPVR